MPPKASRKSTQSSARPFVPPANAAPQPLPPSVEEAYRRKCCQLRHRYNQIEEANEAARLRLHRVRRQIDKMRVERAFLLEQLAKRTSVNVEDSDGTPSPPPTPKEKPMRTKRGHRKTSMIPELDLAKAGDTPLSQGGQNASPSSEAFPHAGDKSTAANGAVAKPKKPVSAFESWCAEAREGLLDKNRDDESFNLEAALARGWKDLPDAERVEFQARHNEDMAQYQKDMEAYNKRSQRKKAKEDDKKAAAAAAEADNGAETEPEGDQDNDMEMEVDARDENENENEQEGEAEAEVYADAEDASPAKAKGDKEKEAQSDDDQDMGEDQGEEKPKDDDADAVPKSEQDPAEQDDDVDMVEVPSRDEESK